MKYISWNPLFLWPFKFFYFFILLWAWPKPGWMVPSTLPNKTKYISVPRPLILTALNIAQVLGRGNSVGFLRFWTCGELLAVSRVPWLTILYPEHNPGVSKFYPWEEIWVDRQCLCWDISNVRSAICHEVRWQRLSITCKKFKPWSEKWMGKDVRKTIELCKLGAHWSTLVRLPPIHMRICVCLWVCVCREWGCECEWSVCVMCACECVCGCAGVSVGVCGGV